MAIPLQRHGAAVQIVCIRQAIAHDPKQQSARPLAATARTAYKRQQPLFRRTRAVTKVMLITGASRGIGAATARLAAQARL